MKKAKLISYEDAIAMDLQQIFFERAFVAYELGLKVKKFSPIFIQADRWYDARDFARRLFGTQNVDLQPSLVEVAPPLRWQLKWFGSPGGKNPLHVKVRQVNVVIVATPPAGTWTTVMPWVRLDDLT